MGSVLVHGFPLSCFLDLSLDFHLLLTSVLARAAGLLTATLLLTGTVACSSGLLEVLSVSRGDLFS